jgi:hypothetical protein
MTSSTWVEEQVELDASLLTEARELVSVVQATDFITRSIGMNYASDISASA